MRGKIESHHFPDVGFDSTVIRLGLMAADVWKASAFGLSSLPMFRFAARYPVV